jgi:hypothetical protein
MPAKVFTHGFFLLILLSLCGLLIWNTYHETDPNQRLALAIYLSIASSCVTLLARAIMAEVRRFREADTKMP